MHLGRSYTCGTSKKARVLLPEGRCDQEPERVIAGASYDFDPFRARLKKRDFEQQFGARLEQDLSLAQKRD